MSKNKAFTLAEMIVTLVLLGAMAILTLPSIMTNMEEKIYRKGYAKAIKTVDEVVKRYFSPENYVPFGEDTISNFVRFFVANTETKELYDEEKPTEKSNTYAALLFKDGIMAGANNPVSISREVKVGEKPNFWVVTEDNIAYAFVARSHAKCEEVLNIATAKNLNDTYKMSCFAIIVDTNGLFKRPNSLEEMQDISNEKYIPNLKNDRYYIFVGSNGYTLGNPKHIFGAKIMSQANNI